MSAIPPVITTLIADTKAFTGPMDKAQKKMTEFGTTADATGAKMDAFANRASTGILGVSAVVGAVSLKMSADFQSAMTSLVTGAGEAQSNIGLVSSGILSMASVVGQTPAELASGMYMIESAGYHGAQGLEVLKAAAEGAATGSAQLATVSGAVTTALHDYNIPASRATQVTSALIATVAAGKTHLEDLGSSLGRVLPTASALGISLTQVGAAMAVQTNSGMSARLAAMHLNATLLALVAPSKGAAKGLLDVGLSSQELKNELSDPRKGLDYALTNIEDHLAKKYPRGSAAFDAALKNDLGGVVGFSTALSLTGSHAKDFAANVQSIGAALSSGGGIVQGFSKVKQDFNFQLAQLKATASAFAIRLGDWLLPKAQTAIGWANNLIQYFQSHPIVTKIGADLAASLLAASLAVKLAGVGVSIASAFGVEMAGGAAVATGTLFGAAVLAALGISQLGAQSKSDYYKAHQEFNKNKVGGLYDVGAIITNTFTTAANKLIGILPFHPQIPKLPVIGPSAPSYGVSGPGAPGYGADVMPNKTLTVKNKVSIAK
jgi:TP901 family phage tail tape measure protein